MTLLESLLWPLTLPYGAVVRLRARAYRAGLLRAKRLDGVVISVGNLTVGGTGKTPMVVWIAERLVAEGKRAGILTRGYGGGALTEGSPSDEVQLLQSRLGHRVEFGVGADRWACGRQLSAQGIRWFILDDGFQYIQLSRDINIVLIDATNPFGGGHLLPAGRLREPRSALQRADIIVITRSDHAPAVEAIVRRESDAPIFYARAALDSVQSVSAGQAAETTARENRLFAFCAIGNPKAFFEDLRSWGFTIAGHTCFPDHHRFSARDIRLIEAGARHAGASTLICTEKDTFNLAAGFPAMNLLICRISFRIAREQEFWATLMKFTETRSRPGTQIVR